MQQNLVRIAVIGIGAMGQQHCKTIVERVPELRLAAVVDTHVDTATAVAECYHVPAFTNVEEMLASGCADAALVVSPHPLHAQIVLPCLQAGLHVLCEKPLAETLSAADAMLVCAREKKLALGVMFQRRFDPAMRAMLDFVHAGNLGPIIRATLIVPEFRAQCYFDANPWRATWQGEGGGVLLNQASHMLDIFAQVAGLPVSLLARGETRMHDIEVEDTGEALLRYAGGGSGYIFCSTTEPMGGEALEVVGEQGKLVYRDNRLTCLRYPQGVAAFARNSTDVWAQPPSVPVFSIEDGDGTCQDAVLRNFARHLLYAEPLHCDAASALASLELANAITLSSYTNREVTLPINRAEYDALLTRLRAESTMQKQTAVTIRVTDPKLST